MNSQYKLIEHQHDVVVVEGSCLLGGKKKQFFADLTSPIGDLKEEDWCGWVGGEKQLQSLVRKMWCRKQTFE